METFDLNQVGLGKETVYPTAYNRELLLPIPRDWTRRQNGIDCATLSFTGLDIWNGYDFYWRDTETKTPQFRFIQLKVPAMSPNLFESKALKLYFFSLANVEGTESEMKALITRDLQAVVDAEVEVAFYPSQDPHFNQLNPGFEGISLDALNVECNQYEIAPEHLKADKHQIVQESLTTARFKSNCLVTGKPDWANVLIRYEGPKIDQTGLLKYLVSYREHLGFHEQCVERIFSDLQKYCEPQKLWVQAHFTRRGGLDINPVRFSPAYLASSFKEGLLALELWQRLARH